VSCNCWNFLLKSRMIINVFSAFITIYVHKCADQSHRTMVQDKNGDWNWAQLLRFDLYNEGCFPHSNPSLLTTETSHCFCTSDFCNGSSFTKPSVHLISYTLVAVLFMIPLSAFVISWGFWESKSLLFIEVLSLRYRAFWPNEITYWSNVSAHADYLLNDMICMIYICKYDMFGVWSNSGLVTYWKWVNSERLRIIFFSRFHLY
jgi:hypothetical protein